MSYSSFYQDSPPTVPQQQYIEQLIEQIEGQLATILAFQTDHTHEISAIPGLQVALDEKAAADHNHDGAYAPLSHAHEIDDVTGLQTAIDAKADTSHNHDGVYAAAGHGHAISQVTDLQTTLDGKAASTHGHAIADVSGLQTALNNKAASSHTHAIGDITNLQTTLDGKSSTSHNHDGAYSAIGHTHNISEVAGLQTALDNKSPTSHDHTDVYALIEHTQAITTITGFDSLPTSDPHIAGALYVQNGYLRVSLFTEVLPEEMVVDAATLDGVSAYLVRGAGLTGAADSGRFILSFWMQRPIADALQYVLSNWDEQAKVEFTSGVLRDRLQFEFHDETYTNKLEYNAGSAFPDNVWTHVLISADAAGGKKHVFIHDADDSANAAFSGTPSFFFTDANSWWIGQRADDSRRLPANLAEFYFAPGQYLDFSVEANRRKFISANGKPVDLGPDGSDPTGTAPAIYLHLDDGEAVANFATNRGAGGDFTNFALASSTSSPSDYAWNADDANAAVILINDSRTATRQNSGVTYVGVRSVTGHATGKWYAEANPDDFANAAEFAAIGLSNSAGLLHSYAGGSADSYGFFPSGDTWFSASSTAHAGNAYVADEKVRIAFDADAGKLWFGDASGWVGGGDPAAGTSPTYSGVAAGTWYLLTSLYWSGGPALDSSTINTGQEPFTYTMPAGFDAWG